MLPLVAKPRKPSNSKMNLGVYKQVSKAWLLVPPLAFLLKDIVATIALLSREPGITANAAFYYAIAMLPGTLS
jgi:hypothetical protein